MTTSVSWVKRFDVLLAGKNRLAEVRKILMRCQKDVRLGRLDLGDDRSGRRFVWKHLFEYCGGAAALSYGRRDGTLKSTMNISISSEPEDFWPLIEHMMGYETNIKLRRA